MDAAKKAALETAGINVDAALNRFMGKEAMLQKFFTRFLSDKSYSGLLENMEKGDYEGAKAAAHMLKSVCGTIGCENMQAMTANIEALLKGGDTGAAQEELARLKEEYAGISAALKEFLQP